MDYKEKIIALLNSQELSKEQKEKLESIFPVLKESEDERIMKDVISFVEQAIDAGYGIISKERKEKWIAWLEKQGEQKPVPDLMPKFLDELRSKKNYFDWDEHKDIEGEILAIINWMNPNYFNGKYSKRKPADNIPQDFKKYVEHLLSLSDGEGHGSPAKVKEVSAELFKLAKLEQKPAWSKEDEINLEKAIWYVENPAPMIVKDSMLVEWLKSLKERYTWKSSDEQMEALDRAQAELCSTEYNKPICDLINCLNKLREK